jgi:hypothetical protein
MAARVRRDFRSIDNFSLEYWTVPNIGGIDVSGQQDWGLSTSPSLMALEKYPERLHSPDFKSNNL